MSCMILLPYKNIFSCFSLEPCSIYILFFKNEHLGFEKSSSFYLFILDAFRITLTLKVNTLRLWRVLQQYSWGFFFVCFFASEESFACYFRCKPTESSRVVYQTWL